MGSSGWLDKILKRGASVDNRILNELREMKRHTPGTVRVLGWDLAYVDGPSLWSSIDILVKKGYNDFPGRGDKPFILDCGANIGISVLNYKRKFPGARIIAFEPAPVMFETLKGNLGRNGISAVELVQAAVWVRNGEVPFFLEGADGSKIVSGGESENVVRVRSISLSDYITDTVDLIKLDIEGAEFEVVPSIREKLHLVKNLVVECHLDHGKVGRFSALLDVLSGSGFQIAINSFGRWVDLVHRPEKNQDEFDQYLLVACWR